MGRRGPRPTPTAIKRLRGTARRDRNPEAEPAPSALTTDDPPLTLEREGATLWREMVAELRTLGMLTGVDRAALAAYCAAWQRIADARREMDASGGAVVTDANGGLRMSPWFRIEKAATETLTRLAMEFGFTPASRPRVGGAARQTAPAMGAEAKPPSDDGPTLDSILGARPH